MAGTMDGKVALVTGGSRGLGKAIAERFAAEGATVAITARTMEPDPKYTGSLRETCEGIVGTGGKAIAVQADLSSAEDRERMFTEITEQVGAPDVLVNNAAVTFLRPLDGFPEKRARLMLDIQVLAPLHLTQLAIPAMRERRAGHVLMLSSLAGERIEGPPFSGFDTSAGFGMYGIAKAGLSRMAQAFAAELYADGIAVNAVTTSKPVATEGAGALDLAKEDTEPIDYVTEAAFRLCTGDASKLTGRVAETQPFLREVGWLS
jgi:NAD(P)-dependent dehydrogenase (short-subunit alcohol dehydrogenase family)